MAKKRLTFKEVAALAESVGLPGKTFAQIAKGESGFHVGAVGHDPGGTKGYGLWQITTKYNDDIIAKYGGAKKLLSDPVANAKAAKEVYDRQGLKAWYGTKYLTDRNAHYKDATPNSQQRQAIASGVKTKLVSTGTKTDTNAAILAALERHAAHPNSSLAGLVLDRIGSGQYDVATHQRVRVPGVQAGTTRVTQPGHATVPAGSSRGQYVVAPGANRPNAGLAGELTHFISLVAGHYGQPIHIGTGTNHNRMTVNGNVSDHWDGHAADIPANANTTEGRRQGDKIAYSAFIAAGVPKDKAKLWSRNGGLYNVTYNGHRIQIIWKTNEGGNHFTHVHIGIR